MTGFIDWTRARPPWNRIGQQWREIIATDKVPRPAPPDRDPPGATQATPPPRWVFRKSGGRMVMDAKVGACSLSALCQDGRWHWLVRRDGRDVGEGTASALAEAQQQAEAVATDHSTRQTGHKTTPPKFEAEIVAAIEMRFAGMPWIAIGRAQGCGLQTIQARIWRYLARRGLLTTGMATAIWQSQPAPGKQRRGESWRRMAEKYDEPLPSGPMSQSGVRDCFDVDLLRRAAASVAVVVARWAEESKTRRRSRSGYLGPSGTTIWIRRRSPERRRSQRRERWSVEWRDSARRRRSRNFPTEEEARAWRELFAADFSLGDEPRPKPGKKIGYLYRQRYLRNDDAVTERWIAAWSDRTTGRRRHKSFPTEPEAQQWLEQLAADAPGAAAFPPH